MPKVASLSQESGAEYGQPVRFGLALHVGEVLYGNIGGAGRLDFTCIGPAVNLVARLEKVAAQLGREPRAMRAVAHRCPCGLPDVVETAPRLPDGTPFPTLYYLTCPRAAAAVSKLEAAGLMREMSARLADDGLRHRYEAAHRDYLARREMAARAAGVEPLPPGTQSAGGMPERVKCLHALVAHELVAGVNPFGAEALDAVGAWWLSGPCIQADTP